MITQCPKCQKTQNIPDAYNGREIKCTACKQPFEAIPYLDIVVSQLPPDPPATSPSPPRPPEEPALCGVLMFLAWLIGIISILGALPTFGASLTGIIPALLLAWAAQVLRLLSKK